MPAYFSRPAQLRTASREDVARSIADLLTLAPPAVARSCLRLVIGLHAAMAAAPGAVSPTLPRKPLETWEDLLETLAEGLDQACTATSLLPQSSTMERPERDTLGQRFDALRQAHENALLMLELAYELIDAGDEFLVAEDLLKESALILLLELGADMYVCRMKSEEESWRNVAADTMAGNSTPLFVRDLDESMPGHPVMRAVHEDRDAWFVVSDDLRGSERGGQSFDCIPFQEGFRSRLAFILRDAGGDPFGLIMLYSRRVHYFDRYQTTFLADCARIVSLTVGRRQQAGSDALCKAAGGMAHVGNNALAVLMSVTGLMQDELSLAMIAQREALEALGEESPRHPLAQQLQGLARAFDVERRLEQLRGVNAAAERIAAAIASLNAAVAIPRLAPFTSGQTFLDLEPLDNG